MYPQPNILLVQAVYGSKIKFNKKHVAHMNNICKSRGVQRMFKKIRM